MRARFNLTMSESDMYVLLSTGSVQIVNGKNEFWIKASDKLRKSVKVEGLPRESAEGKPSQGAEMSAGLPQNHRP